VRDLAASLLAPYSDRVTISGAEILLPPAAAISLTLALHELATNALKYGALSVAAGQVQLSWQASETSLDLVWQERGGPPVEPPSRQGFGTRMIARGFAAERDGAAAIRFEPAGVRAELSIRHAPADV
jgi:two-component sensor histidine kinase